MPISITNPTHRDRIIQHLLDRFSAQVKDQDGAVITWDHVLDVPPSREQQEAGYCLAMFDTSERTKVDVGRDTHFLNLVVEFHVKLFEDDPSGAYLRQALGEVQRVMGLDIYCDGLTMNVVQKGSEFDVTGAGDRRVAGVAVFEVKYRTPTNNPFG